LREVLSQGSASKTGFQMLLFELREGPFARCE
jgi:hypothetical protein